MKKRRRHKITRRKKRVYMARRRRYYPRRAYARRFRRYGRRVGGGVKGMIPPILGGVADAFINPRSPIDGLGSTAVGYFMHDSTLRTIGLYQVGQSIAGFIPFIGTGAGAGQSQV